MLSMIGSPDFPFVAFGRADGDAVDRMSLGILDRRQSTGMCAHPLGKDRRLRRFRLDMEGWGWVERDWRRCRSWLLSDLRAVLTERCVGNVLQVKPGCICAKGQYLGSCASQRPPVSIFRGRMCHLFCLVVVSNHKSTSFGFWKFCFSHLNGYKVEAKLNVEGMI